MAAGDKENAGEALRTPGTTQPSTVKEKFDWDDNTDSEEERRKEKKEKKKLKKEKKKDKKMKKKELEESDDIDSEYERIKAAQGV